MEKKKILVVEDDEQAVEEIRALLVAHGYEVIAASDGREAMHVLARQEDTPSLMLVDLNMPVMNGWDFLKVVRSYTGWSKIPVVLITADDVPDSSPGKFEAALRKPFSAEALLEAIERVCDPGRPLP